ncbi:MAG: hypothetical protein OEM38_10740 [Gammaproteobacteria bacterium]|nr:hypothetical protein [Gammaproteobacteria bacterium]
MNSELHKNTTAWLAEAFTVFSLVSVFSLLIVFSIQMVIPSGPTLADFLGKKNALLSAFPFGEKSWLSEGGGLGTNSAAVLTQINKTVFYKPAGGVAWQDADKGMQLFNQDAVQTLSRSGAELSFFNNDTLILGENTLIIIKQIDDSLFSNHRRTVLTLIDGQLRGRLASQKNKKKGITSYEITVNGSTAKIQLDEEHKNDTEFKIEVDPKTHDAQLTVLKGSAEVISNGETQVIGILETMEMLFNDQIKTPEKSQKKISNPPKAVFPVSESKFFYRDLPPLIRFEWRHNQVDAKFKFELAMDKSFMTMIDEVELSETHITHANLKEGVYYWRVKLITDGADNKYSEERVLNIVRDQTPPELSVKFPPEIMTISQFYLMGKTEPGATILINGKPINVEINGDFSHDLNINSGSNIIVIEAVDSLGNITYRSSRVYGKISENESTISPSI